NPQFFGGSHWGPWHAGVWHLSSSVGSECAHISTGQPHEYCGQCRDRHLAAAGKLCRPARQGVPPRVSLGGADCRSRFHRCRARLLDLPHLGYMAGPLAAGEVAQRIPDCATWLERNRWMHQPWKTMKTTYMWLGIILGW